MFTGIIEAVGHIAAVDEQNGDMRLYVRTGSLDLSDVKLGDSIATNGVCLTAVELPGDGFIADVSRETLAHTRFHTLAVGERVNLEKALMPTSRLGGHIVTGHVDGLGEIVSRTEDARSIRFSVKAPRDLMRYFAAKGSVTVDGISLTVNDLDGDCLLLNIVPHTAQETIMNDYEEGRIVHLEIDIIARYLERLLTNNHNNDNQTNSNELTMETLLANGYHR